ncbi:MAG: type IV pilus twitching motility protein PilT [Vicinamibacterales bacterium]
MSLVDSLLTAILRADGDALVLHVGEKPYVVTSAGPVDLGTRPLSFETLATMMRQVLPEESRRALEEVGAVERELEGGSTAPGERFTVVAARGGEDIWVEIRRHRATAKDAAPEPFGQQRRQERTFSDMTEEEAQRAARPDEPPQAEPTVVLPLPLSPPRPVQGARVATSPGLAGLDRLLRLASARGATTLYLTANSRPLVRVDGEIEVLEGEQPLSASEVEALTLDLAPERNRQALRNGVGTEWLVDVQDVGRVRCMSFRDHRGPGGIFRLIPSRAVSVEQLGLSREIQALGAEPEGLVLIAGPRASGKSTLLAAFVDLIARTRSDHVITLESEIKFVQESRSSLVSQREVRGEVDELVRVARGALRENPDVLVIDDMRSQEVMSLVLDAAESGRLVLGAMTAHTATAAVGRFIDQFPAERRAHALTTLAETLKGVVAQVLLRKTGGGRVAARELLLNTPAVSNLIAEGKIAQLPLAIDSGRRYGMVPLNDAAGAATGHGEPVGGRR